MSRDIKLRLWNPERKVMTGGNHLNTILATTDRDFVKDFERCKMVWLEYIGSKDKSGREIYEGDIVKAVKVNSGIDWDEDLYAVEYNLTFSQFVLKCIKSKNKFRENKVALKSNNQPYLISNVTQVVGNIYQNPELFPK